MSPEQSLLTLIVGLLLLFAARPTGAQLTNQTAWPYNIDRNVPGYRDSGTDHYNSLIDHLKNLNGNATLGHQADGGWCFRYSCEYNIGVYACNDNEYQDVQVPWSFIVEYARHVRDYCTIQRKINGRNTERILSQAFHPDGWNVIVGITNDEGC